MSSSERAVVPGHYHIDMIVIITGVSGSGKTTVGKLVAELLDWSFYDADDFHPAANILKMRSGIPLTDGDRASWLASLESLMADLLSGERSAALACSALKSAYRDRLRAPAASNPSAIRFVYLRISPDEASRRLQQRSDHFMPSTLAPSQFETLEEPVDAFIVEASSDPEEIAAAVIADLRERVITCGLKCEDS